ncbi:MAG TPA: NADH-quinone oxidoreductase subunit M [Balneolaceae bacterium]|nr:NADH-quinone oxidoreductase subunit M [Balneolaceae bacterium]
MSILLNICIFLPIAGILGILATRSDKGVKWISLIATLATFVISLVLLGNFNIAHSGTQQFLTVGRDILPDIDVKYLIGLDGFSLLLFMLTTLFGPIVVLASWYSDVKHVKGYYAMLLLLETAALGFFASLDLVLFYVFFEISLIPMYFIIGIWGGQNRIQATLKFFVYTMAGSLIMLVGLIYLGYDAGSAMQGVSFTTDWRFLSSSSYHIGLVAQTWLFLSFAVAFGIKLALFPLYTWLPNAYTEAPTAGTVFLAAIMAKMGTYGLLRICMPIFPNAFMKFAPYMAILAVIGIMYGALLALVQNDFKRLLAYSSFSHMGFIVLGLFAFNMIAVQGAVIQMINHGLSTGALFLIVGMIYERTRTRRIDDYGGIAKVVPMLTVVFMIAMLASIGLPGLNGFIGEFMILNGSFNSTIIQKVFAVLGTTGTILAAAYMLLMTQRMMFGSITNEENRKLIDLDAHEIVTVVPLIVFIVWIGVRPGDFMQYSRQEVKSVLQTSRQKRAAVLENAQSKQLPAWTSEFYDVTSKLASQSK